MPGHVSGGTDPHTRAGSSLILRLPPSRCALGMLCAAAPSARAMPALWPGKVGADLSRLEEIRSSGSHLNPILNDFVCTCM